MSGMMKDLTGFQRDLLRVLIRLGESNGKSVISELEEHYGNGINKTRVYENLNTLVSTGHVHKSVDNRRSNTYKATHRGRQMLEAQVEFDKGVLA